MTPKGNGVIRGRRDLFYDPKSHGDLCGRFPSSLPQKVTGSLEVAVTYFMTAKVNMTLDLDLDLRVKHLTRELTTDVPATL